MTKPMSILCEHCGNKRCPHAEDHDLLYMGSNVPDQPKGCTTHERLLRSLNPRRPTKPIQIPSFPYYIYT